MCSKSMWSFLGRILEDDLSFTPDFALRPGMSIKRIRPKVEVAGLRHDHAHNLLIDTGKFLTIRNRTTCQFSRAALLQYV